MDMRAVWVRTQGILFPLFDPPPCWACLRMVTLGTLVEGRVLASLPHCFVWLF